MKKLLLPFLLLVLGVSFASCQKDLSTLDDTVWSAVSYEDLFDGAAVFSDDVQGTVYPRYEDGELILYVSAWGWYTTYPYEPDEYKIVKYTDNELVIDLFYVEYTDVDKDDCTLIDTYRGKKIYMEEYLSTDYYYYFKPNGVAVDLGFDTDYNGNTYYYDSSRLYCKRAI
ncbi:MAG: hypothetical protein IKZ91_01645 [Bacteroidales bacterium]|nr:hypothetical protein [Bacteroidales bacterium]